MARAPMARKAGLFATAATAAAQVRPPSANACASWSMTARLAVAQRTAHPVLIELADQAALHGRAGREQRRERRRIGIALQASVEHDLPVAAQRVAVVVDGAETAREVERLERIAERIEASWQPAHSGAAVCSANRSRSVRSVGMLSICAAAPGGGAGISWHRNTRITMSPRSTMLT